MFIDLPLFINEPNYSIAILIAKNSTGGNHTGILTVQDNKIKLFHLAWHFILKCDSIDLKNISDLETHFVITKWVKFVSLTTDPIVAELRLPAFIKNLELIYNKNKNKIPYSLKFLETRFSEQGNIQLGKGESGLTCSTFVASVLSSNAIDIVDLSTWKAREEEDSNFKNEVIKNLNKYSKNTSGILEHIANVTKEEINFRLKPEEIAVASSKEEKDLPADYEFCATYGALFNTLETTTEPSTVITTEIVSPTQPPTISTTEIESPDTDL